MIFLGSQPSTPSLSWLGDRFRGCPKVRGSLQPQCHNGHQHAERSYCLQLQVGSGPKYAFPSCVVTPQQPITSVSYAGPLPGRCCIGVSAMRRFHLVGGH